MSYVKIYTTHEIEDCKSTSNFLRFDYDRWEDDTDEEYHFEYFYDNEDLFYDDETGKEREPETEADQAILEKQYSESLQFIFGWMEAWKTDHPGADWAYGGDHEGGPRPESELYQQGQEMYADDKKRNQ